MEKGEPNVVLNEMKGSVPRSSWTIKIGLQSIVQAIDRRLTREYSSILTEELWTATFVLAGLKYKPEFIESLLKGVRKMEESSTYQLILA